ncbi:eukaryotic release factor 1 [Stylonychia lemnae]|uniref:Eukaryotic peptide chain release factor subunit 1 n=2 Tax=Stylonychia lemnae TaxID=5949 RepID=ERF1_STYLE|nr:RecName: Full=Eukaryotic peptide chain release factor subunit 1; Short=Eukaryotic release factor 1; Short=eRF1 [Stylonychia lemnae]AAK12092.1 eukaryotic release factor 1 [Stylonychia lemnae]CDW89307.1 eukaryotic release factor 1 [Stylonychia lemnae]|eukprot:CDW89307.1 eukaryotic release factor 1 [Stylonychia lemnae]
MVESIAAGQVGDNKHIEMWKIKRLINKLENCKGNGTSMVSLIIPPKEDINKSGKLLVGELSAAQNIKSRITRQSVITAITSTKEKLKLYRQTPTNGLCIYCGVILMEDGKTEKKINFDFEPFRPINQFMYFCGGKFQTEPLTTLLADDDKFGFIIVDGNGALYATLQGNSREILQKITVELPKKHRKGGQSSVRFARLREEKRHNYLRKVAELAGSNFITNDKPNVTGLVLAGNAGFKNELSETDMLDKRLLPIIVSIVDVSYGGENGLNEAITLSADALTNVKFVAEKKLVSTFFEQISLDTGMIVFGVQDTMKALELGAVETILLFEELEITRYVIKNPVKGDTRTLFLNPTQQKDSKYFKDQASGLDMDVIAEDQLAEWLCHNYQNYGAQVEFITDKSQEGYQFVKGFGGIGGFLRYKVDMEDALGDVGDGGDDFDPDTDFI